MLRRICRGAGSPPGGCESVTVCEGDDVQSRPHVVVIGGGIAGLAAALALTATRSLRVSVLESLPAVGGKLSLAQVAGLTLDVGAEALLLRRPEAVDLARAVGLGPDLQDAATTSASVWSRASSHGVSKPVLARSCRSVGTPMTC